MILVLITLYVHVLLVASICPPGFVNQGTKCYHFSHDKEAYALAELLCEQIGAQLATVNTAAEGAFLSAQAHAQHTDHYWIGLNDIEEEGVWRWHTNGAILSANVANWDAHEPNTSNPGLENCVVIKTNGKWGDEVCMKSYAYICQTTDEQPEVVG